MEEQRWEDEISLAGHFNVTSLVLEASGRYSQYVGHMWLYTWCEERDRIIRWSLFLFLRSEITYSTSFLLVQMYLNHIFQPEGKYLEVNIPLNVYHHENNTKLNASGAEPWTCCGSWGGGMVSYTQNQGVHSHAPFSADVSPNPLFEKVCFSNYSTMCI